MIKLTPQNISDSWPKIRSRILKSIATVTKVTPKTMQRILTQLQVGKMQCWNAWDCGYIVTSLATDYNTLDKSLVIYSIYMDKHPTAEMWDDISAAITKYAIANGCSCITAWTRNDNVVSLATKMGFSSDTKYLVKEV